LVSERSLSDYLEHLRSEGSLSSRGESTCGGTGSGRDVRASSRWKRRPNKHRENVDAESSPEDDLRRSGYPPLCVWVTPQAGWWIRWTGGSAQRCAKWTKPPPHSRRGASSPVRDDGPTATGDPRSRARCAWRQGDQLLVAVTSGLRLRANPSPGKMFLAPVEILPLDGHTGGMALPTRKPMPVLFECEPCGRVVIRTTESRGESGSALMTGAAKAAFR
jgi:hypothetical protein